MTNLGPVFEMFDEIRLINLASRPDRRRSALSELERAGISSQGPRFRLRVSEKPTEAMGFPSPGVRGCFTSHREVLRDAANAGAQSVLVFEDDIAICNVDAQAVSEISRQLATMPWAVVYFGYIRPQPKRFSTGLHRTDERTMGGHFYGIRGPMIERMVEFMDACELRPPGDPRGGPMFRDGAFNHYRKLHPETAVYLASPALGVQRSSRTDLHELRLYDRLPILKSLAQSIRSLKSSQR